MPFLARKRTPKLETEAALQKETKRAKREGVGGFRREIFPEESLQAEGLVPSLSLYPSVDRISELGLSREDDRRKGIGRNFADSMRNLRMAGLS